MTIMMMASKQHDTDMFNLNSRTMFRIPETGICIFRIERQTEGENEVDVERDAKLHK